MNGKLAKLQSALLDKEAEIERMKAQLEAMPSEKANGSSEIQIRRLQGELNSIRKRLEESEERSRKARSALKEEKAARSKIEAENSRLQDRLRSHQ